MLSRLLMKTECSNFQSYSLLKGTYVVIDGMHVKLKKITIRLRSMIEFLQSILNTLTGYAEVF